MSVRITGLQEIATLQSGDYIAIDNESNGTHKFDAMKMGANMSSNIAPAYSTAATYAIGDFCMHDGILYKCTTAISTPESWTASHWTQTSAGVALAQKVDKVSGRGLSQNDFTNALKTKLDGIASGAEVNVQADWAQTNTSADDYIKNKPVDATSSVGGLMSASDKAKLDGIAAGAEVNVQSDWTETNTSSDAYIKNKPTDATSSTAGLMSAADKAKLDGIASGAEVNVQADWSQTNTSADDYIKNKPVDATSSVGGLMSATDKAKLDSIEQGAEVNVQADWNQTNTSADDYIKNKPTNATTSTAGLMSASDKTKLDGIETGAQVNVIDGVKVDGTLLTVDGNKDVDIVGKANQTSLAPQYSSDTGNYVRGNYVIYQNNLYKCLQDTSGVWDATKWEQVDIGDDLEQKANIDGLYEEMTVGGAEQLISDTFNIESVPYNFRTSGGSLEIGDRETDKMIGGTIAWNQLVTGTRENSTGANVTWEKKSDFITHISGTLTNTTYRISLNTDVNIMEGHKYLIDWGFRLPEGAVIIPRGASSTSGSTTAHDKTAYILSSTSNSSSYIGLRGNGVIFDNDYSLSVFDLTKMFGSTIADYLYTLEQNTAGAGVAFFKKLFPAPYYAYNAGQLMSVNVGSHVMNGFNQWDEEWEVGDISATTGANTDSTSVIRTKNYISVLPKTVYFAKFGTATGYAVRARFYDADKNYIGVNGYGDTQVQYNQPFTTPENAQYMRFTPQPAYGTTYHHDICINIAWDGERNGEYEPYVSHIYELDDTLELRGIPKLDVNNQLYYDGDVYESDGNVTRKYGIVDLGTLNYIYYENGIFYHNLTGRAIGGQNMMCSKYPTSTTQGWTSIEDKAIVGNTLNAYIYIRDVAYTDAASFKTAMSGVYLVYELATPTTESATPYTNPQIVDDWGTETYTDYSYDAQTRDVQIPVGHETRYMANLKAKLEMAPESPNGDGDYIVRQTSGENAYVAIGSSTTIQHKAEIDGTYDDMNVGGAKQLLSNVFEEDQVPYTFRTSGGSIDIGDREYDEIVGGTIAWNQILPIFGSSKTTTKNNITFTDNRDGSYTIQTTDEGANADAYITIFSTTTNRGGHVFALYGSPTTATENTYRLLEAWSNTSALGNGNIGKFTANGNYEIRLIVKSGTIITTPVKFVPQFIDLTQMLGSTIAEYIYTLEIATAGAGVAWFRKLFPKPYYEYNAGELLSVEGVSSHDMTGFNQWDEEWEVGGINNITGQNEVSTSRSRSKNYIPVMSNTTYYHSGVAMAIDLYDADKNYISQIGGFYNDNTFTTPSNCHYIRFFVNTPTMPNNVCINLHWDGERDGDYESYVKYTYALDDSLTLRGIPKLDASNNLYYDGDTYESDGTVTRRYGVVDLGTLTWIDASDIGKTRSNTLSDVKAITSSTVVSNIVCSKYMADTARHWYNSEGNNIVSINGNGYGGDKQVGIIDSTLANKTAAQIATALSGVYLVYELETPTTETAEAFQSPQIVDDFGTEEYVTTSIVPVGHDTKYTANLRAKIEMAPDSPSGDGDYIVRQADGTNSYVPLVIPNELPTMPTTDGTYRLQVVVASGTPTLSWVSAT